MGQASPFAKNSITLLTTGFRGGALCPKTSVISIPGMASGTSAHQKLQQAAFELFAQQGFHATSLAQIAAHAGVSELVLSQYFATKAQLLLDDVFDDAFDPIIETIIRNRPPAETPHQAIAHGIAEAFATNIDVDVLAQRLISLTAADIPLVVIATSNQAAIDAIANALEVRGEPLHRGRILAACAMAGFFHGLLPDPNESAAELRGVVAELVTSLDSSC